MQVRRVYAAFVANVLPESPVSHFSKTGFGTRLHDFVDPMRQAREVVTRVEGGAAWDTADEYLNGRPGKEHQRYVRELFT